MRNLNRKLWVSLLVGALFLTNQMLFAAKPSLSAATNAKKLGVLSKIIQTNSAKANFFIFKLDPTNVGIFMDAATVGLTQEWINKNLETPVTLLKDPDHIKFLISNKRLDEATAAKYINYMLYFTLPSFPGQKFYIEEPWPGIGRAFVQGKKKIIKYPAINNMRRWE